MKNNKKEHYDCFISHAYEDKDSFVRELANQLQKIGYKIWYDEFSLTVGESLTKSINKGIKNSTCGIVVLSPHFFNKKWTKKELNWLSAKKNKSGQDIILPVWHNITHEEVYSYSPTLADLYAANSAAGMKKVCEDLSTAIERLKRKS